MRLGASTSDWTHNIMHWHHPIIQAYSHVWIRKRHNSATISKSSNQGVFLYNSKTPQGTSEHNTRQYWQQHKNTSKQVILIWFTESNQGTCGRGWSIFFQLRCMQIGSVSRGTVFEASEGKQQLSLLI